MRSWSADFLLSVVHNPHSTLTGYIAASVKLEFHGTDTDTDTNTNRLSCNFVNVYTRAYRVQYTFTRVHARILTDNLATIHARKSARVGRVGGQVGEDCRACPARG